MLRTFFFCAGFALILTIFGSGVALSPVRSVIESSTLVAQASDSAPLPTRVEVLSIGLDAPIVYMGIDDEGNMDVPGSRTNLVGWYKDGTIPGDQGSAVFDAHVVAAFKRLHNVHPGDDIYVTTSAGTRLHFKIESTHTYPVGDLSSDLLFNQHDAKRLNLITCAGVNLGGGNYTKRFVAFAVLVEGK
jgi:LPXTG-site transpeptidase (sortase) family protein